MSKLIKKIYYGLRLSLASPLCVSSGDGELTDNDILRTWDGEPFVPGTSFAGAFRDYCRDINVQDDMIFGTGNDDNSKMSSILISDFYFDSEVSTDIRDGVRLKDKIAVDGAKYDYEIIEYGSGILYLQLNIWDDMDEQKALEVVKRITGGIMYGDVRFGSMKNSGLGKFNVTETYMCEFGAENVDEWIEFTREKLISDKNRVDVNQMCIKSDRYVTISIPLNLTGGISIRQYSTKVNQPDFVSLMRNTDKKNENPVIPGSSWKGAIRDRMFEIVREFGTEEKLYEGCMDMFGYVSEGTGKDVAKASEMAVTESIIENNGFIRSTRNAVSRFDNSTVGGALYTERCAVKGNTTLEVKVKSNAENADWFIGLILLAVKDIQKGYLSIGGGAAIGRGIFESGGQIEIVNGLTEEEYIAAFRKKIMEVA